MISKTVAIKQLLVALGLLLACGRLAHSQTAVDLFADEVAKVRAAGEPLNLLELQAEFKKTVRGDDILAAAAVLDTDHKRDKLEKLPFVGSVSEPPAPGKPWAELEAAEKYLATRGAAFEFLESLSGRQNPYFGIDYADPASFRTANHEELVGDGARLLQLKFYVDLHRGTTAAAVHDVKLLLALAAAMNEDRSIMSKLTQRSLRGVAVRQIELLLNQARLSAEQMSELQAPLRKIDTAADIRLMLRGQRAHGNTLMTFTLAKDKLDTTVKITKESVASLAKTPPPRREDAAFQLQQYRLLLAAVDPPLMKTVAATEQLEKNLGEFVYPPPETPQKLTKLLMVEHASALMGLARRHAFCQAADVALAAEQYRLATERWPPGPAALVPKYLPAVPLDPFDGKPLRWLRPTEAELKIYTIGNKKIDGRGVFDYQNLNEGITVPLR